MKTTLSATCALAAAVLLSSAAFAQAGTSTVETGPQPTAAATASFPFEYRSIDGSGNNLSHPEWASAGITLLRRIPAAYDNGADEPAGGNRASAREISNLCVAQSKFKPNPARVTDFVWQWGQFLDHDIDLTPTADPAESFNVPVPAGDAWFDPDGTGVEVIFFDRSTYRMVDGVRQQLNAITGFIDASNVYGSDEVRARTLRTLDGTGRLRTSAGDLLPFNEEGLPNAPDSGSQYFLAGDVRANEQVGLTAMHTLFVREHNHWAEQIHAAQPAASDDAVYEMARAIVIAEMQSITYHEFLPVLLGPRTLSPYRGYNPQANPGIDNIFSTAVYRFGHSMLSPQLLRLDDHNREISAGHLSLANSFFNPAEILAEGIDPILRGLARQRAQNIDSLLVPQVRNFLFGPPGAGGFDLAALNIQRGRDHGIPSYNEVRAAYGLHRLTSFDQVNRDPAVWNKLAAAYATVDDIDAWVGVLAERHAPGALVGPTIRAVLKDQFERLRDGDRFWYQGYLPPGLVRLVESQNLARIIRRNTGIGSELPGSVWRRPPQPPKG